MNHITAFMEIPTASHVLLQLGQPATDLLFPVEPTNHNLLSTGWFNSLVTSSSHKSFLHGGFTNALIFQSCNTLLIKLVLKNFIFPWRVIFTWLKLFFKASEGQLCWWALWGDLRGLTWWNRFRRTDRHITQWQCPLCSQTSEMGTATVTVWTDLLEEFSHNCE